MFLKLRPLTISRILFLLVHTCTLLYMVWLFCIFPCTSFLLSSHNSFSCPLNELYCCSGVYFLSVLLPLYRYVALLPHFSVLEIYPQTSFFFSLSLCHFSFVTHNNCLRMWIFFASSVFRLSSPLLIHSHLGRLSSLFLFLSLSFSLSLSVLWMLRFPDFFFSIYFYLLVLTCCSGVYP